MVLKNPLLVMLIAVFSVDGLISLSNMSSMLVVFLLKILILIVLVRVTATPALLKDTMKLYVDPPFLTAMPLLLLAEKVRFLLLLRLKTGRLCQLMKIPLSNNSLKLVLSLLL